MIKKATVEQLIKKMEGNFTALDVVNKNKIIFNSEYSQKKAKSYVTVVLHNLWKQKNVKKISRGIFTNNPNYIEVNINDWNSVIDFYTKDFNGFVAKEWLWLKLGLTKNFPKKLVIYTNLVKNIRKISNIEIRPTKIVIDEFTKPIFELFELVQIADFRDQNHYSAIENHIKNNNLERVNIIKYKELFKRRWNKLNKNYNFENK